MVGEGDVIGIQYVSDFSRTLMKDDPNPTVFRCGESLDTDVTGIGEVTCSLAAAFVPDLNGLLINLGGGCSLEYGCDFVEPPKFEGKNLPHAAPITADCMNIVMLNGASYYCRFGAYPFQVLPSSTSAQTMSADSCTSPVTAITLFDGAWTRGGGGETLPSGCSLEAYIVNDGVDDTGDILCSVGATYSDGSCSTSNAGWDLFQYRGLVFKPVGSCDGRTVNAHLELGCHY